MTEPKTPTTPHAPRKDVKLAKREPRIYVVVRFVFQLGLALSLLVALAGAAIGWNYYQSVSADLPTVDVLQNYSPPVMSRVYAADDSLVSELAAERRIFVPISAIPKRVSNAFIAAEDQNFYSHKGVDPMAIARAAVTDLSRLGERRRPVGASTITQQVARNMLLGSDDVSLRRKVQEALLALRLERVFSKPRILELYLNEIYLGEGSYGVASAAESYFNKRLEDLSLAECAMLASLPKSPSNYNPFREPDAALERRNWVISRMHETGVISKAEEQAALAEPLKPATYSRPPVVEGADWFAEEVRQQLIARFGGDRTGEGGLIVHTSLDPLLQQEADRALRSGLMRYDHNKSGWRGSRDHLTAEQLGSGWAEALADHPRPPGMLPEWQLAVVLNEEGNVARVGVLPLEDQSADVKPEETTITLADMGWARLADNSGAVTGPIRHLSDAIKPGEVVMVQFLASLPNPTTGAPVKSPGKFVPHFVLCQVPRVEAALVSLEPQTGRVVAMSGGWSFGASKFNRATQALRQPGSSFKPFVYLTAMEQGISPSARFDDEPITIGDWQPNNYELTFGGPTPLHVALEQSLNLVTVRLAEHIGMDAVAKTAIAFHLVDAMPRVLPAALGAVETTVLREAGAYASIASGGHEVRPTLVDSVQDHDGQVLWRPAALAFGATDPAAPPILSDPRPNLTDAQSAYQIELMMQGVVKNGTGVSVAADFGRDVAGKTGTSQDFRDGWFAGFTPDLVTVVWMGFDAPQSLGEKQDGAHTAGPIWRQYMQYALKDRPKLAMRAPAGVEIFAWDCAAHECIDAFKPEQTPGVGYGVAALGGTISQHDTTLGQDNAAPEAMVPAGDAAKPSAGTGVDSGVGGLY